MKLDEIFEKYQGKEEFRRKGKKLFDSILARVGS